MHRRGLNARTNGAYADLPIGNMRQQGSANNNGLFLSSDPALGQYPSGPDDGSLAPFEKLLGRKLDYILGFGDTNTLDSNTFRFDDWPGRRLVMSLCLIAPGWDMAATAAGAHDAIYQSSAARLAPFVDRIVSLRPGWEMNINGFPWGGTGSGGATNVNAANYVLCFQRYVNYLREAMPGALIDWCPNFGADPTTWYPGDEYCDVIGLDAYMNSAFFPGDSWGSIFESPFGLRWLDGFSSTHGKFMSLPEWATNFNTGNYITPMAAWLKRPRANRCLYQSYWNSNDSFTGKLSGYPVAQAAYLKAFGM